MLIKAKTQVGKSNSYASMDKFQDDGLSNIVKTAPAYLKQQGFSSGFVKETCLAGGGGICRHAAPGRGVLLPAWNPRDGSDSPSVKHPHPGLLLCKGNLGICCRYMDYQILMIQLYHWTGFET
jgi:hypothetical protein